MPITISLDCSIYSFISHSHILSRVVSSCSNGPNLCYGDCYCQVRNSDSKIISLLPHLLSPNPTESGDIYLKFGVETKLSTHPSIAVTCPRSSPGPFQQLSKRDHWASCARFQDGQYCILVLRLRHAVFYIRSFTHNTAIERVYFESKLSNTNNSKSQNWCRMPRRPHSLTRPYLVSHGTRAINRQYDAILTCDVA